MKNVHTSLLGLGLFCTVSLFAQNLESVLPEPVPKQVDPVEEPAQPLLPDRKEFQEALAQQGATLAAREGESVLVQRLKKVRLAANPADLENPSDPTGGPVEISGLPLFEMEGSAFIFEPFLDLPVSIESVERMKQTIRLYLAQVGRPFSLVYTPPQDITDGVIRFVIRDSVLGQIQVEGNNHFSDRSFTSRINLAGDGPLDGNAISTGLDRINLNPFRDAAAEFGPGSEPGTTDVRLRVNDRAPWRFHGGVNNSGTRATTEERMTAGIDWGNVFGTANLATIQWTSDFDAEYSKAISANTVIDLPRGHNLVGFGAYSEINSKTDPEFDQQGESWQVGFNYDVPLVRSNPDLSTRWTSGFDFKSSDNNLDFIQPPFIIPVSDNLTHIIQARTAISTTRQDSWGATTYGLKITASPGDLGSQNDDEAFEGSRAGAEARYIYGNLDVFRTTQLPKGWSWTVQLEGQLASTNLLGSETFSGGGVYSVRGYEEGELIGDNGGLIRQELRLPALRPASQWFGTTTPDALSLFAFQDAAVLWNTDELEGETTNEIASVGLGLTYQYQRYFTLQLAYGWQLMDSGSSDTGDDSRIHFNVSASF